MTFRQGSRGTFIERNLTEECDREIARQRNRDRDRERQRQRQERNIYREKSTIIKDFEKEIKKGEKHNIYKDISYRIMRKIDTWRKKSEETKRDMINRRG